MLELEKLRRNMTRFHQAARWDNGINYISLLAGIAMLGYVFYRDDNLPTRVVCGVMLMIALIGIYDIFKHGDPREAPFGLTVSEAVTFLRSELARRRDLLRRAFWWGWGATLLGPAMALWLANRFAESKARGEPTTNFVVTCVIVILIVAGWMWWCCLRRANRLQKQIDALPRTEMCL